MLTEQEHALLQSVRSPAIATDGSGLILYMNQAAEDMFGTDRTGERLTDLMPARMHARHQEGFRRYLASGESRLLGRRVRVPALRADGTEIEIGLRVRMFKRPDGTDLIIGTLLTQPDGQDTSFEAFETALQRRAYQLV